MFCGWGVGGGSAVGLGFDSRRRKGPGPVTRSVPASRHTTSTTRSGCPGEAAARMRRGGLLGACTSSRRDSERLRGGRVQSATVEDDARTYRCRCRGGRTHPLIQRAPEYRQGRPDAHPSLVAPGVPGFVALPCLSLLFAVGSTGRLSMYQCAYVDNDVFNLNRTPPPDNDGRRGRGDPDRASPPSRPSGDAPGGRRAPAQPATRSNTAANPCPPPMHMVSSP